MVAAAEVVTGVVNVTEVCEDRVVGGKAEPEKKVGSVSSPGVVVAPCVGVAVVDAAVGCIGAEVGATWVVMVVEKLEASVVSIGVSVAELAAALLGVAFIWSFSSRLDLSIVVAGVFLAARFVSVTVFAEGWADFCFSVLVVACEWTSGEVLTGSSIMGTGHLLIPAVTL